LNIAFEDIDQLRDALETLADIVRRLERPAPRAAVAAERVSRLAGAD
jgi:hypothetical protein